MQRLVQLRAPWRDPEVVLRSFRDETWAVCFSSGPRWSYFARAPTDVIAIGEAEDGASLDRLKALLGPTQDWAPSEPPFSGGVVGLASYELGESLEPLGRERSPRWPDLAAARFDAVLAFDRRDREVLALGRGHDDAGARAQAQFALSWLDQCATAGFEGALATSFTPSDPNAYEAAVADVVRRIEAGEIFQANIARSWRGKLVAGAHPADLFERLAKSSPAPFAAYLRLPGLALVSNSPERFLRVQENRAVTEPIKGTRPRGCDAERDEALARELEASVKDRAENLMIVDLMRNDLARACRPGSVSVPKLFDLRSYANVHHLVSTVEGRLKEGLGAIDLLFAAFPPGSITGAPKVQAMRVIAGHEAPRGPYCGSLFWLGYDGAMDSNVLIRSIACAEVQDEWLVEARAGAGIVADSDPHAERLETEAKISAIAGALLGEAQ
jgi:para-aminobenzoate synthetase component 1